MAVNVAVVGLGYWGPNLARIFARLPGACLSMLCDSNEERLATVSHEYPGVEVTTDYKKVLAAPNVDAVVLATPAATHFVLALEALQAGKHVFVEKPLAQRTAECRQLLALAEARRRVLMVGHVYLYNGAVRKVKEFIDAGVLGRIYYVYAQRLNLGIIRQDVNALWNLAPHDISVLNYWLGTVPTTVFARGYGYVQPGIEDVVFITLEYPGGIAANIHVSWLDPHKVRRITVVGSDRMLVLDDANPEARVVIYEKRAVTSEACTGSGAGSSKRTANGVATESGDIIIPNIPFEEPLKVECRHFIECISQGAEPLSSGTEGLRVVQVLEAADMALRSGASVAITG